MKRILALILTVLIVIPAGMTQVAASESYTCTVKYFLMNKDMSTYHLDKTETFVISENEAFSPEVYKYEGFVSPKQKSVVADRNRTVNYFYDRETYTIKYITSGSDDTPESQEKIFGIDAKITKIIPEREGYTFAGWTDSASSDEIVYNSGDSYVKESDITLYALWNINTYIINFDSNGGSLCDSVAYEYKSTYGELPSPKKHGYNFAGWYFDSYLTNPVDSDDVVDASGDRILYAKWTERKITSLEITSLPIKNEYFVGDTVDTTGLQLFAKYDNGETETVNSGFKIEYDKLDDAGTYDVNVIYDELSCNYSIEVSEIELAGLEIKTLPKKLTYYVDDNLDTTDMVVEVTYNNGKSELVANGYVAEYDFSLAGESVVTISYSEYDINVSDSFKVNVTERPEIYSDNITVEMGEIVAVPIYVKNNSGLMGYHINLTFDNEALTPVSTEVSELFSSGFYNDSIGTNTQNVLSVVWSGTDVVVEDGVLFTAYFRAEDVVDGDYEINLSYEEADTITGDYSEVRLVCTNFNLSINNDGYTVIPRLYSDDINIDSDNTIKLPIYIKDAQSLEKISLVVSYDENLMQPKAVTTVSGNAEFVYDNSTVLINVENLKIDSADTLLLTVDFELSDCKNDVYNILISSDSAISTEVGLNIATEEQANKSRVYADEITIEEHLVSVPVYISGNSGIMGYKINVGFDNSVLELSSATCGREYTLGMFTYSESNGEISLVWNNAENITKDGILFTLNFERLDDKDFSSVIELSYVQEDTFNEKWNDVVLECESSTVESNTSKLSGDVNKDGLQNLKDIVILKRYLVGGYDESVDAVNADINNDSRIDIADLMILERYLDRSFEEVNQWF